MDDKMHNRAPAAQAPATGLQGDRTGALFDRVEFYRNGLALLPAASDPKPGVAFLHDGGPRGIRQRFCTCGSQEGVSCLHTRDLVKAEKALKACFDKGDPDRAFRESAWFKLGAFMGEGASDTPESVRFQVQNGERPVIRVSGRHDFPLVTYFPEGDEGRRFMDRCGRGGVPAGSLSRGEVIDRLRLLTMTETERLLAKRGTKTRGRVLEEGFWFLFAYHCFREYGSRPMRLEPAISRSSGEFTILCKGEYDRVFWRVVVPRERVKGLLGSLGGLLANRHRMAIHPIPLKSIFKVNATTEMDLEIRPMIEVLQAGGEKAFFDREGLERYRYGDLIYIPELELLAELESNGDKTRKFGTPVRMVLKKSQISSFLEEVLGKADEWAPGEKPGMLGLRLHREAEWLAIEAQDLDPDWCWLSASYGFGDGSLTVEDLLEAHKTGQRYVGVAGGWVDLRSEKLSALDAFLERLPQGCRVEGRRGLRLSRLELLRLRSTVAAPPRVGGRPALSSVVESFFNLKAARPLPAIEGMGCQLRPYQAEGLLWLWFLVENGLGGLLCDEMGLGKTHQIMALIEALAETDRLSSPCLVVAPTTVLSHWEGKLRRFAPGLATTVYHGGERRLDDVHSRTQVLLTSYGILRQDVDRLKGVEFSLAVFDEIQYLKNPETLVYQAAQEIRAPVRIGLTGTPIENRLSDLKALLDLTVPGYLGGNRFFERQYARPIAEKASEQAGEELARLLRPFVLRRRKSAVLQDLPPKIEDFRSCALSADQLRLYREVIAARSPEIRLALAEAGRPVPYIHIFALLDLLKRICDHPALVTKDPQPYTEYESGKWEVFKELLAEGIDSGQKIVVYSQYLGMIGIMEEFLRSEGIGYVTLTGATRHRGGVIERFNEDPDCRVYVGSLRAGGTGIDLVAASMVIHYDRWWNAAREDQATDRVHRIGQKRGVQVFKLITEGTLEEKIAAIIEKKRVLMEEVVPETDPGVLRQFSREDLLDLMDLPSLEFGGGA